MYYVQPSTKHDLENNLQNDEILAKISNIEREIHNKSVNAIDRNLETQISRLVDALSTKTAINPEKDDQSAEFQNNRIDCLEQKICHLVDELSKGDKITKLESQISKLVNVIAKSPQPKDPLSTIHVVQNLNNERIQKIEEKMDSLARKADRKVISTKAEDSTGENSESSQEIVISTRVPKTNDNLRRSLIWVPDSDEIPVLENPQKSKIQPKSNIPTPNKSDKIHIAANAKLISALEKEEKRLRDNESRYVEKIKILQTELSIREDSHQKYLKASKQISELEHNYKNAVNKNDSLIQDTNKLRESLKESEKLKLQAEIKAKDLDKKIAEISINYDSLSNKHNNTQSEILMTNQKLESVNEALINEKEQAKALESKIKQLEMENARLSLKFVLEREQFKSKIADVKRENNSIQDELSKSRNEVAFYQSLQNARENQIRNQIQNSSQTEESIKKKTETLIESHKIEKDALNLQLDKIKEAYFTLEHEYLQSRQNEATQIQIHCKPLTEQIKSLQDTVNRLESRDREQSMLLADMIKLVKSQKSKIAEMIKENDHNLEEVKNQTILYQTTVENLQKERLKFSNLNEKFQDIVRKLNKTQNNLNATAELKNNLESQLKSIQDSNSNLISDLNGKHSRDIQEAQRHLNDLKTEHAQNISIKNKMLEDQNETIRNLKQSLESKVRAHQQALQELDDCNIKLEEYKLIEHQELEEFRKDIEDLERSTKYYETLANDYKMQRDEFRSQNDDLLKKIHDRNSSIEKIESEVENLKNHFNNKEAKNKKDFEAEIERIKKENQVTY